MAGARLEASEAGIARAAIFLGLKGALPRSWDEVHEVRLVAKALGLEREPAKRLAALATPDGLRAAIVQKAFGLKIRGVATPSRLRAGLAAVALERAFGNQIKAGLAGKLGLSAKAGRLLAAQLAKKPRDFGTDARLIAALAAEHVGVAQADLPALRLAVLRRYLDGPDKPAARPRPPAKAPLARPRLVETVPAPPPRRSRRGGRISRASPRRCAGTPPCAPRAGPATARPTSATSGICCARSAPSGASPRSSSSAC